MENAETCICCGDVIPEGRQVCPKCERIVNEINKLGNPGPLLTPDEIRSILERSKQNKELYRFMPGRMNGKTLLLQRIYKLEKGGDTNGA